MRAYALGVGVNARIYDADNSWERGVVPFFAPVCVMYMNIHQCEIKRTLTELRLGANKGMHVLQAGQRCGSERVLTLSRFCLCDVHAYTSM